MAGATTYTTLAAFNAAAPSAAAYGFDGVAPDHGAVFASTFTGGGGATFAPAGTGSQFIIGHFNTPFGPLQSVISEQSGTPHGASISFAPTVDAFAFNFGSSLDAGQAITVLLSTGDSFSLTIPANNSSQFFGVVTTGPFTSLTITGAGFELDILNYYTETVPEPASLMLLASGVAGLAVSRRRAKGRAASALAILPG
jgi:hypothetical protein